MKAPVLIAIALGAGLSCSIARAETSAERYACMNDAFRVCWREIPNRHQVFLCLVANRQQLSPACRAAVSREAPSARRYRSDSGENPAQSFASSPEKK